MPVRRHADTSQEPSVACLGGVDGSHTSVRAKPALRLRIRVRADRARRRCSGLVSWIQPMTHCWYPEDSEASQRDLAPHTFLPNGPEEVIFEIDVFERVLAKERFVDVAEARTAASQPLQLARGDYNRNRLAPASKLNFQSGLGFVNDSGKMGTGLGDGIPFRHDLSENSIMGSEMEKLPDWEQLPAAERHLQ